MAVNTARMTTEALQSGKVAVIGLGLTGIATVKNLLEIGFDVIGIERSQHIGGLWTWSETRDQTTVLKSTVTNVSKQCSCYQDFPFPDDVPNYPSGANVEAYINAYADHFGLRDYFRLGTSVQRIERSSDGKKWSIKTISKDNSQFTELFDKVVITNGPFQKAFIPEIPGMERFKGEILHSQNFKSPDSFKDKHVVVVGLGNTGGDTAVALSKVAATTWMSHRSGALIVSRGAPGSKPADHKFSRRIFQTGQVINATFPAAVSKISSYALARTMTSQNKIDPAWNLLPARPIAQVGPVANEYIIQCFRDKTVLSVPGIKRFLPSTDFAPNGIIEFTDGATIPNADAVIFCTGYATDFSIFAPEADPTANPPPEWEAAKNSNGLKYPKLYQGIFHTRYPESLAFIGPYRGHSIAAFSNADLSSQAIAQIWSGNYPLPTQTEMEDWCSNNYKKSLESIKTWRIIKVGSNAGKLEHWLNEAAGNEVNEKLGWGRQGWEFWWKNRKLYYACMDGVNTPYIYRLFDGRPGSRKKWDGAGEAILKVNGTVAG